MRLLVITSFALIILLGFVSASGLEIIGQNSRSGVINLQTPTTNISSSGGGNVSSVTSSTNCIIVSPTTGNVILTFNSSCSSGTETDPTWRANFTNMQAACSSTSIPVQLQSNGSFRCASDIKIDNLNITGKLNFNPALFQSSVIDFGNGVLLSANTFLSPSGIFANASNLQAQYNITSGESLVTLSNRICNATSCYALQSFLNDSQGGGSSNFNNTNVGMWNESNNWTGQYDNYTTINVYSGVNAYYPTANRETFGYGIIENFDNTTGIIATIDFTTPRKISFNPESGSDFYFYNTSTSGYEKAIQAGSAGNKTFTNARGYGTNGFGATWFIESGSATGNGGSDVIISTVPRGQGSGTTIRGGVMTAIFNMLNTTIFSPTKLVNTTYITGDLFVNSSSIFVIDDTANGVYNFSTQATTAKSYVRYNWTINSNSNYFNLSSVGNITVLQSGLVRVTSKTRMKATGSNTNDDVRLRCVTNVNNTAVPSGDMVITGQRYFGSNTDYADYDLVTNSQFRVNKFDNITVNCLEIDYVDSWTNVRRTSNIEVTWLGY